MLQVFPEDKGYIDHIIESEWRFGINIEQQEIGGVIGFGCGERGMEFKGSKVCQPDQGIEVVAHDIADLAINVLIRMQIDPDIVRSACRCILFIKCFSLHPVRVTVKGKRPVVEER
jgi:hypothetical protein